MSFYDFMTWFWAALWGAATAVLVVFLANGGGKGIALGVTAGATMLALVYTYRQLRRPE